jgi:hypothetical protein
MPEHKAITVLKALETLLTNLNTTGTRVERTRGYPKAETPAISIRAADVDPINEISNTLIDSAFEVETLYHVAGSDDDLDERIFEIDAEVWAAIMVDRTLSGAVIQTEPQRLTFEIDSDKEIPTAVGVRRWRFHIRHSSINATA